MFVIPLLAIPNQRFSIRLEETLYELTIKVAKECMVADIKRNDEMIIKGVRCLPETPLIPHRYLEGNTGNFYFETQNGVYPHYSRFGNTDVLWYLTRAELQERRNG